VKNLNIIVDNSERDSGVPKHIESKNIGIEYANLRTGSYLITDSMAVDRLTTKQFGELTSAKSLFRRLLDFKKTYDEPILLIEGNNLSKNKKVSAGALRGAISYICCLNRIPILYTANEAETAEMLYIIANQTQFGLGHEVSVPEPETSTGENAQIVKPKTPEEIQSFIVQALPDVGPSLAGSIMTMYGSLRTLFSATVGDLTKVEGIGPKKAKKIANVFDFEYGNEKKKKKKKK
jgi:Fanconi anemia group M protein